MLDFKFIGQDMRASVVVFLVALPLCLGISLASGAPLLSGVVAGMIGGIVIGFFSNSHTSVSGPAAGLTVIVLNAITELGDFSSFTLAVLIAGIIQIGMGALRAGAAGSYFPNSVIKGMLAAIGLILILKQFPHAIGYDADFMGDEAFKGITTDGNTFTDITNALRAFSWGAVIISSLSLLSMIFWEKLAKKGIKFFQLVPGALFAVVLGIILNEYVYPHFASLYLTKDHLVSIPIAGGFGSLFDSFSLPNWGAFSNPAVYKVAITLAIVASLETLLSLEAVDKIDPRKRTSNKNKELIAQGIGNSLAGLIGALPVTSVIVRSSANINSGGATKLVSILHGIWLLLAVVLLTRVLELIPLASLAAVLILVGYKLCSPQLIRQMKKHGTNQLVPFLVTIIAILFTDLLTGIFIGIIAGFIFVFKSQAQRAIVVVNEGDDYLIRFMKDVSFLQKPWMTKALDEIPHGSSVVIDGSNHVYIDNDIISIIEEFLEVCDERNIKCEIVRSTLAHNNFFKV
jgi:MFS superfamily sulfate permease-like transporter